jgi:DNA-binding PadR family transcriptional regulator
MTDAELVILSLAAERPQHAYEIQQAIESRRVRQWASIGFSSVYLVLGKLEDEGLLHSQETAGTHPSVSKRYEVTDAGRNVLQTAIADRLSTPREPSSGFLLGLANLHHLRPEQVRHALDGYEARLRVRLAEINALRQAQAVDGVERPLQVVALFDYSLTLIVAELEWLAEFRQAWEAQAPAAPPQRPTFRAPVLRSPPTRPSDRTKSRVEDAADDDAGSDE